MSVVICILRWEYQISGTMHIAILAKEDGSIRQPGRDFAVDWGEKTVGYSATEAKKPQPRKQESFMFAKLWEALHECERNRVA